MATLRYWTGTSWEIVPTGTGGDGGGIQGPPGADGQSVEVFGPQANTPTPYRKGDVWLFDGIFQRKEEFPAMPECPPVEVAYMKQPTEPIVVPLREVKE
jgi:hypothetical protein